MFLTACSDGFLEHRFHGSSLQEFGINSRAGKLRARPGRGLDGKHGGVRRGWGHNKWRDSDFLANIQAISAFFG